MTQKVSDEVLGRFSRQQNDWFRRVREGSLDPDTVASAVHKIINRHHLEQIRIDIFNAYMGDLLAVQKAVMKYVYMIIGLDGKRDSDGFWEYLAPQGQKIKLYIDQEYIDAVEKRLGLNNTHESKDTFKVMVRKIFSERILTDPDYDFMDQRALVKAVIDVNLTSDKSGASYLLLALCNRTTEENFKLYNRIMDGLMGQGYSRTEAEKAIRRYCVGR